MIRFRDGPSVSVSQSHKVAKSQPQSKSPRRKLDKGNENKNIVLLLPKPFTREDSFVHRIISCPFFKNIISILLALFFMDRIVRLHLAIALIYICFIVLHLLASN
jgi:hypothetical protein